MLPASDLKFYLPFSSFSASFSKFDKNAIGAYSEAPGCFTGRVLHPTTAPSTPAKHPPPREDCPVPSFCSPVCTCVDIYHIWQSKPTYWHIYISSHMVSILASSCNGWQQAQFPFHGAGKQMGCNITSRYPELWLFSLILSLISLFLSPNRCRIALLTFDYYLLNWVTSCILDFHCLLPC